jgi:uncharacterized membrane protein
VRRREQALCGAVALVGLASAASLALGVPPFLPREMHRLLHFAGAVLFLGNVAAGALWFTLATLARSTRVLTFAVRVVNLADIALTAPGALLLVVNGAALAPMWGGVRHSPWMLLGTGLFVASGLLWAAVLVPIQVRLATLLEAGTKGEDPVVEHPGLPRLFTMYGVAGGLSGAAAVTALVAMVLRFGD